MEENRQRTIAQNRALHLYFTQLADELTSAGLDMRRTLKAEIDIRWDGRMVKEYLWRPIMEAKLGKTSTTEMTTTDIDKVFDTITKHLGERFGLYIQFPSIESQISESLGEL